MPKRVIAIDGYSATGKSTLARQLAKRIGYTYVDSGAMFRAVTHVAIIGNVLNTNTQTIDDSKLVSLLNDVHLTFGYNTLDDRFDIFLNGKRISENIRSMQVVRHVSAVAAIPEVRNNILKLQHSLAQKHDVVVDGRDIGTVVFPNATIKIFVSTDLHVRAKRRHKELLNRGESVSLEEVIENLVLRDEKDSSRTIAPLKKAGDAITLDNTNMTIEEQLCWAYDLVLKKCRGR